MLTHSSPVNKHKNTDHIVNFKFKELLYRLMNTVSDNPQLKVTNALLVGTGTLHLDWELKWFPID